MRLTIRRIPVWPVIKMAFVIYFILSFILHLFGFLILMGAQEMMAELLNEYSVPMDFTSGMMIFAGLFGSLFIAIGWTFLTLLALILYNAASVITGGIEIETDDLANFDYQEYAEQISDQKRSYQQTDKEYRIKPGEEHSID